MRHGKSKVVRSTAASKQANAIYLKHEGGSYLDFIKRVREGYDLLRNTMRMKTTAGNGSRSDREKIEEAVRAELTRATGQPIKEIDKCLCHGEYLTEDCLSKLEQMGAGEDFFLKAQHLKAILIKNALIKGLGKKEATREISTAVLLMHQEYKQTGKVNATKWLKDRIDSTEAGPDRISGIELFGKPQTVKYRFSKTAGSAAKPLTPAEIIVRLEELAREIREIVGGRNKSKGGRVQGLRRLTIEMAKLHQQARHEPESTREKERDG